MCCFFGGKNSLLKRLCSFFSYIQKLCFFSNTFTIFYQPMSNNSRFFLAGMLSFTTQRAAFFLGSEGLISGRSKIPGSQKKTKKNKQVKKKNNKKQNNPTKNKKKQQPKLWPVPQKLTPSRLNFQTFFWLVFPLKVTKTRKFKLFVLGKLAK